MLCEDHDSVICRLAEAPAELDSRATGRAEAFLEDLMQGIEPRRRKEEKRAERQAKRQQIPLMYGF